MKKWTTSLLLFAILITAFTRSSYAGRYYDAEVARFISIDPALDEASQQWLLEQGYYSVSPYAYVANNPVRYTDPDGKYIFDTLIDIVSVAYDIYDIASTAISGQDVTATQWTALGADVVATLIPFATGGGALVRAASKADDVVRAVDKGGDVKKTYQTYTKTNSKTGQVYTGRTSGKGSPFENVAKRDRGHHMNKKGYGRATLDKSSTNKSAIRGREQQLIKKHGGAQSQRGTSGNTINSISPKNPKRQKYLDEAEKEFGRP